MIDGLEPGDPVLITEGEYADHIGLIVDYDEPTDLWVVELDGEDGPLLAFERGMFELHFEGEEVDFDRFGLTADELKEYVIGFAGVCGEKIDQGRDYYDHGGYQEAEAVSLGDLLASTLSDIESAGVTLATLHLRVTRILGALEGNV